MRIKFFTTFFPLVLFSQFLFAQQLFTVYNTSNTPLLVNQINCIAREGNTIWAGTDYGIVSFDGSMWNFFLFDNQSASFLNNILAITIDSSGNKWIGTSGGGLGKFDGVNWTVFTTNNSQLPSNIVSAIAFDSQNRMWIGTTAGLAIWDLDTTWIIYQQFSSALMSDHIECIVRGANDTMWVGTQNGGITRVVDTVLTTYIIQNGGVPDNTVLDIALDTAGNRWLGCAAHGLAAFHFDSPPFYEFNPSNADITSYTVNSIAIDSGTKILCATATGGLCKYLGGVYWQIFSPQTIGLPDSALNDVLIDNFGSIWLASENTGIIRFDEQTLSTEIISSEKNFFDVKVFPNPADENIFFSYKNSVSNKMEVQVFNINGELLKDDFINPQLPDGKIEMKISDLNKGAYLLKIISGKKISSAVFVKA